MEIINITIMLIKDVVNFGYKDNTVMTVAVNISIFRESATFGIEITKLVDK